MSSAATLEGDATLRLFLALRLAGETIDALARWGDTALPHEPKQDDRRAARRVPPDHLHVTLAFLGGRPATELPGIVDALRAAAAGSDPFSLVPVRYRETRSVGMVVLEDPTGKAGTLAAGLHDRLARLGVYRPETRSWLAHITVLRFHERPRLRPPLDGLKPFIPSDAAAFLSRLHPSGARYEVLEAVPFATGGRSHKGSPEEKRRG